METHSPAGARPALPRQGGGPSAKSDRPTSLFVAQKRGKPRSARGRRDGFQNRRPPEPSFFAPVRLSISKSTRNTPMRRFFSS